ncbi:MAG TPA: hypothetical protein VJ824_03535, partial [Bacillota bacterium]|nr:hypothetical protein [Bacillota bacterium]
MDKKVLEGLASTLRKILQAAIKKRLLALGIDSHSSYGDEAVNGYLSMNVHPDLYRRLFQAYAAVGYEVFIEEVSYTWFIRLMAIRYMEVKDVLPDGIKIIGHHGAAQQPEILSNYHYLGERVKGTEIEELKASNEEAGYRKLFLAACNRLGNALPFLFQPLGDWMGLLLPGKMLEPGGIIDRIISNEGLTKSFEEGVEAIGWLYQFYMS